MEAAMIYMVIATLTLNSDLKLIQVLASPSCKLSHKVQHALT